MSPTLLMLMRALLAASFSSSMFAEPPAAPRPDIVARRAAARLWRRTVAIWLSIALWTLLRLVEKQRPIAGGGPVATVAGRPPEAARPCMGLPTPVGETWPLLAPSFGVEENSGDRASGGVISWERSPIRRRSGSSSLWLLPPLPLPLPLRAPLLVRREGPPSPIKARPKSRFEAAVAFFFVSRSRLAWTSSSCFCFSFSSSEDGKTWFSSLAEAASAFVVAAPVSGGVTLPLEPSSEPSSMTS
mmetsp:Transcript_29197/g.63368  ORF Transcript_29197/g.63368 Transcript_29197/m.63368 type:complete len:244 (+) Transcript_29197:439-1170(+)